MPLRSGKENIGYNLKELAEHGSRPRSRKQMVAIALRVAGVPPKHDLKTLAGSGKRRR